MARAFLYALRLRVERPCSNGIMLPTGYVASPDEIQKVLQALDAARSGADGDGEGGGYAR